MSSSESRFNLSASGVSRQVHCFRSPSERIFFEDGYLHYLHPEALAGIDRLTIQGLKNAEVYFLGQLVGEQLYWRAYLDNSGILNIVDCENVLVSGADVVNTKVYQAGNPTLESSCAVNVSRSQNVVFRRSRMTSGGKVTLQVHSGSQVGLKDVVLKGYYFELLSAGSSVTGSQVTFDQQHAIPDSHSAIWLGSSMRHGETNVLYEGNDVTLDDCTFDMKSGRSLVSGNGSYDTRSLVELSNIHFTPNRDETFGVCTWNDHFQSIEVTTDFAADWDDYISTPDQGQAKFVNYYSEPGAEIRPGGPTGTEAPIVIDGVSSEGLAIVDNF